jgi:hypothetical protein
MHDEGGYESQATQAISLRKQGVAARKPMAILP